jgi:hypothetical protein
LNGAHSSHSVEPCTNTAPPSVAVQSTPLNRSAVFDASARAIGPCSLASTLSPRRSSFASFGQVEEVFATHTDTSGGWSETVVNELAAMPSGAPASMPQNAVTPLGKQPKACRNSA